MEISYPLLPFLHNGTVGTEIIFFQKKSWPVTYCTLRIV